MAPHAAHLHDRVPHLFEFLEDNYMVEWWDCDFRAWYYQPYRDRIARAFEAAKVLRGGCPALASWVCGAHRRKPCINHAWWLGVAMASSRIRDTQAKDGASRAAAAAADTSEAQASKPQTAGDDAAAKQAEQPGAGGAAKERSRAEAARRQRGGADVGERANVAEQRQQQQAEHADAEGAAGRSADGGMAQQAIGKDVDAEAAVRQEAAEGELEHERSSGDPQGGGVADARAGDPVARASDRHVAANSNLEAADAAQQGADSSVADQATLPADAAAKPERQQPRQQQRHATDAGVGQKSDGSTGAAAKVQTGTSRVAGQDELQEDIESADLAVDQEDYNDAGELQ